MNSNRVGVGGWKLTQRTIRVRVGSGSTELNADGKKLNQQHFCFWLRCKKLQDCHSHCYTEKSDKSLNQRFY